MKETNDVLWTQLFQDKPIPRASLENFQAQLMSQIMAEPVNFGEEIRLAKRRKWGLGLAISLIVVGFSFGVFLWFESDLVYQGLNVLLVMLYGLTYATSMQHVGQSILQNILLLGELKTGLGLLWGVVSWPLLGVLSIIVIFRSWNPVRNRRPSI